MAKLHTGPRIADPDTFYSQLIELHQELTPEQSRVVNARLVLLLANHIGDTEVLAEALELARRAG